MKYNLRLDKNRIGAVSISNDFTNSQYLVLYGAGDKRSSIIYGIKKGTEVVTKEELLDSNYPDPRGNLYLLLSLTDEIDVSLKNRVFSFENTLIDTQACIPQVIKYTQLPLI